MQRARRARILYRMPPETQMGIGQPVDSCEVESLYAILGVSRDADRDDIRRAFRRLARCVHPDVSGDPISAAGFQRIRRAYEVLSNPDARARYDALAGFHAAPPSNRMLGDSVARMFAGLFDGLNALVRTTARHAHEMGDPNDRRRAG